jgi:NADH-quinone oxidoreductase subunit M
MGLPGLSGFVGEFLVLAGSFPVYQWLTVIAASAVSLTVGYRRWTRRRVTFGSLNEDRRGMPEMTVSEAFTMAPLCALIVIVGVYPQSLVGVMQSSVGALVAMLGR